MSIKVSVIIPVYNPGPYIEDCIESLLRQSLPDDAYEAIFVNDGSTDGTPARLDSLAAEHPNMHVIHQENSGWSGKPRNVGIAAAQGEFVMFVDNDDWLGDEALERMYTYGVENDADVVVGKMAGRGRPVPRELFRVNRPRATLRNSPLIDSLTPHKMFRRSFMDETGLRFLEGRRRLEDHVFVAEAFLAAKSVAVLSDYVCYYHVKRDDASNAGFRRIEPVGYFGNLREALDVVEKYTEPGPFRDQLYRRWFRNEMIDRMRGARLLATPDDGYRQDMFREMHKVAVERFGPGVTKGMLPTQQIVGALIKADRYADVEKFARWEKGIRAHAELTELGWDDDELKLAFTAGTRSGEEPVHFVKKGGEELLALPEGLDTPEAQAQLGVVALADIGRAKAELVVRERVSAAEFYQPVEFTAERVDGPGPDEFRLVLRGTATIAPGTAAGGAPLADGIWDVWVRVQQSGWKNEVRLGSVRSERATAGRRAGLVGESARLVVPYWTVPHGNLALDAGGRKSDRLTKDFRRLDVHDVVVMPEPLLIETLLPVHSEGVNGAPAVLHLTGRTGSRETVRTAATLTTSKGRAGTVLCAERPERQLPADAWDMAVTLGAEDGPRTPLPLMLVTTAAGAMTVRRSGEGLMPKRVRLVRRLRASVVGRAVRKVRRMAAR
ncbi:glycosyltransferase [Streptomyces sp. NBC_01500]|uniref:glycosyltransferase family 2 protein n=1 Tax=Streptomyces sp. NBC_01500 TaxID=2903886 RepID=UPI0022561780|nr:glycosyltransferase [Streptomyces sp. NBC_01500]MCX4550749.1 glycosyltransferase [Streptomyces sp. NBC_01500]